MAGTDSILFRADQITVDGKPVAIEDGSAMLEGASRFENEVVASGTGDDYLKRKRVPTTFKFKLQFGSKINPEDYAQMVGVQITARDSQTQRRALMNNCAFAKMGEIGGGTVEVTFNVLSPVQWL